MERICRNCRYFVEDEKDCTSGKIATKHENDGTPDPEDMIVIRGWNYYNYSIGYDFGCVHWKSKEK